MSLRLGAAIPRRLLLAAQPALPTPVLQVVHRAITLETAAAAGEALAGEDDRRLLADAAWLPAQPGQGTILWATERLVFCGEFRKPERRILGSRPAGVPPMIGP